MILIASSQWGKNGSIFIILHNTLKLWNKRCAKHAAEDIIPVLAFSILKGYEQQSGS